VPDRLTYDEAMRAATFRLQVQDKDLKDGTVEMMTIRAKVGSYARPWGLQGGFAIVYKFRTKSGKFRALRCFLKQMDQETQFRYERIGPYFHTHIPDITAGFHYHNPGILLPVKGQSQKVSYPVIEMEWIEGATLLDKVNDLCTKRDRVALEDICQQWLGILHKMRQARIAHGDLAATNVLVRPDGKLVLIDYDGVYIPEFAGKHSTLSGQADYQHPQMNVRPFSERMDAFSALVIYTALLAVTVSPEIWGKYMKVDPQQGKLLDTNFLFTQQDFQAPSRSPLLQELQRHPEQRIKDAVRELVAACGQPIDQVRFPLHIIDPDYEKKQALHRIRIALQSKDISAIAAAYTPANAFLQDLTQEEHQVAQAAYTFVQTCGGSDDVALLAAHSTIENIRTSRPFLFTAQQQQTIAITRKRTEVLARFRTALASKNIRQVVHVYDSILDTSTALTQAEREHYRVASDFIRAYDAHDDTALDVAYKALATYKHAFIYTGEEQKRVVDGQTRKDALEKFRVALRSGKPQDIITAYNPILGTSTHISQQEYAQLETARLFVQAYTNDDDDALLNVKQELQQKHITFLFTMQEQQRIELAVKRATALERFRKAWQSNPKQPDTLLSAYDASLLDTSKSLTAEQRQRLQDAQKYMLMYREVQVALQANDNEVLRLAFDKQLDSIFSLFTHVERQRIASATQVLEVKELLDQKAYEQAIRLAQRIVKDTRREIDDFLKLSLHTATMRFIRTQDVAMLQVRVEEDTWTGSNSAEARWRWPANDLIRNALIVWRTDTWPQRPHARNWQDPEWHRIEVLRASRDGNYTTEGYHRFPIKRATHIYVQVFTSMLDSWEHEHMQWRYSDGTEPTSRCEAGNDRITWKTYG